MINSLSTRGRGKMKKLILLILLFIPVTVTAQTYLPAVEVWSEPVRVDSFAKSFIYESSSSLSLMMDTIYLFIHNSIYRSSLVDSVWVHPLRLNNYINNGNPIRHPSISKDGGRLFFCRWSGGYGGWDL